MEASEQNEMNEEEMADKLAQLIGTAPATNEKQNVHTFLHNVATSDDTTKTGYLKEEELGTLGLTVRADKELALISDKIMRNAFFKDFFDRESEITTSTSLSRDAKLLELAVITRREVADVTKRRKENKSWFKKKEKEVEE